MEKVKTCYGYIELTDDRAAAVARKAYSNLQPKEDLEIVEIRDNGYKASFPNDFGVSVSDPISGTAEYLKRQQRPAKEIKFIELK